MEECIDSVINQSLDFKTNVQLILVDDGSTDKSKDIILRYHSKFPDNIIVLSQENSGQAVARNNGLKYAQGEYVNFLDSDDYISPNTLEDVLCFFENNSCVDIVAIPMILFGRVNGNHRLNYKFKDNEVIDLINDPNNPLLSASSSFIKREALSNLNFDTRLISTEDALLINKILLDKKKYGCVSSAKYYYRQRFARTSTVDSMTSKKEYFTERLKYFFMNLINYSLTMEGEVLEFIQYLLAYDLQWMLRYPNLDIFDSYDEKKEFLFYLKKVIGYIDLEVISENSNIRNDVKSFFVYLKNNAYSISVEDEIPILSSGDFIIDELDIHRIWFSKIELKNNFINFVGIFSSNFDSDSISIFLVKKDEFNNETIHPCDILKTSIPDRNNVSFLSMDWIFKINFQIKCYVGDNPNLELSFLVTFNDNSIKATFKPIFNFTAYCGISTSNIYFVKNDKLVLFKPNSIHVMPYKFVYMLRYEYSNIKKIFSERRKYFFKAALIRCLFVLLFPFMKNKKIWLFEDRLDFADDNARQLFEFSSKKDDGISKYFVIGGDSEDYALMRTKHKNVVKFNSFKHKLLYFFAEKNISSYVNENFINPFYNFNPSLSCGLLNSQRYFLQHGVTKDDVSLFINGLIKRLSLILTVSDFERDSFLSDFYNFDSQEVQVLGFPRYDKLNNENLKQQILFSPTWRLGINNDFQFLNSDYYESINSFFNNERLKNLLLEYDYQLLFKPHPELMKYIHLFDIPDHVNVVCKEKYSDLFNESMLLITDYSSIFFDFSYLKKPIIYYQPNEYGNYEEGYFDYNSMGFGDLIKKEDVLINKIESYLENGCIMENKYEQRVNKFFKFDDKNNSQRVYNWILND